MSKPRDYPTIEHTVGNTPLVRLQRVPGETSNTILGKLEGNNTYHFFMIKWIHSLIIVKTIIYYYKMMF